MSTPPVLTRTSPLSLWSALPLGLGLLGLAVAVDCGAGADSGLNDGGVGQGGHSFEDGGTGGGGILDKDAACAVASDVADLVPVSLLLMFDKSGSMMGSKWFDSTAALQAFFCDPASAGLRVGIRFFPDTGCDETCVVAPCAVPKVEPAPLTELSAPTDQQEDALYHSFDGVTPSGGTPMYTALQGALIWATTYVGSHPAEKALVVLVTDGEPTECNDSVSAIAELAADAYETHGVLTFAIGLEGSFESTVDHIAEAGGGQGFFIGSGNAQEDLLAALNEIRGSTVACEYVVPSEVDGQAVNPALVNVFYTPGGSGSAVLLGQVPGLGACTEGKGGWFYDNPAAPTRIIFCPSTCAAVQADTGAKIEVLLGCSTVPA